MWSADEEEKREAESFRRFLEQQKTKAKNVTAATAESNNDDEDEDCRDEDVTTWC